jgi:hypothetical protein
MYAAAKGKRISAFSVLPLIRAHIVRPRSELSVPAPETKMNVISGLSRHKTSAAAMVIS